MTLQIKRCLVLALVLLDVSSIVAQSAAATTVCRPPNGWLPKYFPSPPYGHRISDPDGILTDQRRQALEERLEALEHLTTVPGKGQENAVPIQMAVAIVEKMKIQEHQSDYRDDEEEAPNYEEEAAENFARILHDSWGVGYDTDQGGTGVLLFLSTGDRVVHISRGGALESVLTTGRIDQILHNMRPFLKQMDYVQGITQAMKDTSEYIQQGPPNWRERLWDALTQYWFVVFWFGILFNGMWASRRRQREQRAYVETAAELSELDRAQARVLQGNYEATSCPICLETFASATEGSDGQPIRLLRCGHVFDETCWNEWVTSGQGSITKCPICKKDVGTPSAPAEAAPPPQLLEGPEEETRNLGVNNDTAGGNDRALRLFQQERNFRLARLSYRYPSYVTSNQLQRWTSTTYNGELARDPTFVRSRPQTQYRSGGSGARSRGGMGSSGFGSVGSSRFGGGTSSGGRSGRF